MYHFIINPKSSSGRGIRYWWIVKKELDNRKIPYIAAFTKYMGHATEITQRICKINAGIKNIVVLGGDGTVNEVINGIEDYHEVLLGYIPSGSSNDLARSLKIPQKPIEALEHILKPTKFEVLDYGLMEFINSSIAPRKFCCSSGIGYDARVCSDVQASSIKEKLNRIGAGKFVYIAIAIKQLIKAEKLSATVIVDGFKTSKYKRILLISNMIHKYAGGGLQMAPKADPCDGKLSICLAHDISTLRAFLLLPTLFIGTHVRHKGVEAFPCREIEIIMNQATAVHVDGEVPTLCSHVKISCISQQLRMIL